MHVSRYFAFPETALLMGDAVRNYSEAAMEDRSGKRSSVEILAHLRQAGRSGFPIIIRNVSVSGFVCDGLSAMKAGARCFVRIPDYESMSAHVIWNDGFMIGLAFNCLLAQQVVDAIACKYPATQD
jgi:hypothetical protein